MADLVFDLPAKESYWLVQIKYGDPNFPTFVRLTDANDDFRLTTGTEAGLYKSCTTMAVKTQANTGVFERKSWEFEIPINANTSVLINSLGNGRAHAPLDLAAWEYAIDALTGEIQILKHIEGKVGTLVKNPEGRSNLVRFIVLTLKTDIERPLGVPAQNHCQAAAFGDAWCGFVGLVSLKEGGSLTAIDGLVATITGLSSPRDRYWHRGYIEKDGIRILIKEWVTGTSFVLGRFIPFSWEESLPVSVTATPGCDRRIQTCDEWGRIAGGFSGWGLAIPEYNPTLGTG